MERNRYPLKLVPVSKEIIWGGNRLKREYGKTADFDKIAESWELTVRHDGMNLIANGEYAGMTLGDYLGEEADGFPLLIKLIDACDKLSIQVHPDD
ncbi:MAG: mannose-6-phosphate isomerase, partial [Clostridia bacterium]|nr:mannose-6-phosphate isomerase [Clostridia bacterium]